MKEKSPVFRETARLAIGALIVSALVVLVYALIQGTVRWQVPVSALIGFAVMVGNFFFLAKSTDSLFAEAAAARGDREMSEEEIAKFTAEYQLKMSAKMKLSFIIRIITMAATIALTFIFLEGLAATVPLLMQRPLLYIGEIFRRREDRAQ